MGFEDPMEVDEPQPKAIVKPQAKPWEQPEEKRPQKRPAPKVEYLEIGSSSEADEVPRPKLQVKIKASSSSAPAVPGKQKDRTKVLD